MELNFTPNYTTYTRPANAIGMTSDNELCLCETYAREAWTGEGRIVDLGCWLGATTMALARGVMDRPYLKLILAIDRFIWETWMDPVAKAIGLEKVYAPGRCFYHDTEDYLSPYSEVVELVQSDLLEYQPSLEPIEFLFVDAMKSWELANAIASKFFPLLIHDKAYVVMQDFCYPNVIHATNHLVMWQLRESLKPVHHVPDSSSVVFKCVEPITEVPHFDPQAFTASQILEAYEWSCALVQPNMRCQIDAVEIDFLIECGFLGQAHSRLKTLVSSNAAYSALPVCVKDALWRAVKDRKALEVYENSHSTWTDAMEDRLNYPP